MRFAGKCQVVDDMTDLPGAEGNLGRNVPVGVSATEQ